MASEHQALPPHHIHQGHGSLPSQAPIPPPKLYRPATKSAEVKHSHQSQHAESPRNVSFAQYAEYGSKNAPHHQQEEVSIELGDINIALGESASNCESDGSSSSGRSIISNAPSVEHFNISFEFKKTFREHNGARVMKKYHRVLKKVYNGTLSWTYNILLFVFGIILAIFWALINALVAILQTWFISPLMRVSLVIIRGLLPIILEPLGLFLKMCARSCGGGDGCMQSLGGHGLRTGIRYFDSV